MLATFKYKQKEYQQAISGFIQAKNEGYESALQFFFDNTFPDKDYLTIAQYFHTIKDITSTFHFYQKAESQKEAAFILGQYFENGIKKLALKQDLKKAFQYYDKAAQQRCLLSLASMERIAEKQDNNAYWLTIVDHYLVFFSKPEKGLQIVKNLLKKNLPEAQKKIDGLIQKNSNYAFIMGNLYVNENNDITCSALNGTFC